MTSDTVTVRELSVDEWTKLASVHPYSKIGLPDIAHSRVVVGFNTAEEIVAYWVVFEAVHVEPFWIRDDYRKRVGVLRRLWTSVLNILRDSSIPFAFAVVKDDMLPTNGDMASRLGFKEMDGKLFYLIPDKAFRVKLESDLKLMEEVEV